SNPRRYTEHRQVERRLRASGRGHAEGAMYSRRCGTEGRIAKFVLHGNAAKYEFPVDRKGSRHLRITHQVVCVGFQYLHHLPNTFIRKQMPDAAATCYRKKL